MNYSDIIATVCSSVKCKLYLEVGCQFATTINKVTAKGIRAVGVDVMKQWTIGFFEFYEEPSDKFFSHFKEKPDVIFIDADHKFEAVQKDFVNSLNILNEYGIIFLHDTDPYIKEWLAPEYCNDSYKIVDWIKDNYPELDVITLQADEPGLTIVKRHNDRRVSKFV
jgi:hypothetical protein